MKYKHVTNDRKRLIYGYINIILHNYARHYKCCLLSCLFFIQAKMYFYSYNSFIVVYRCTSGYFGMTCRERILYKHWTLWACQCSSGCQVSFEHTIPIVRRVLFVYHSSSILSALQINTQQYNHYPSHFAPFSN